MHVKFSAIACFRTGDTIDYQLPEIEKCSIAAPPVRRSIPKLNEFIFS